MNTDTYGAIKRDQQKIIDKYEAIVAELKTQLEAIVVKQAAIKICYETLNTILSESACPCCGMDEYEQHVPDCEMYEVIATLREIVEGQSEEVSQNEFNGPGGYEDRGAR